MEAAAIVMIGLYAIGAIASIVIIIYLIVKRLEEKKKEDFEDRDN
jgi:uncharacterized membrane protein